MKFKVYNITNSKSFMPGKSTLRVHERAGLFTFSKTAGELMGFQEGCRIEICQDEDSPKDFFVFKSVSPDAFPVRIKENSPSFNCVKLATLILDEGEDKKHIVNLGRSTTFQIGPAQIIDDDIYHPIIRSKK